MEKTPWLFVGCIIGFSVSAAALILQIPSLFSSDSQGNVWSLGVSTGLVAVSAAGMLYLRPSPPANDDRWPAEDARVSPEGGRLRALTIKTGTGNRGARAFYRALGYADEGVTVSRAR